MGNYTPTYIHGDLTAANCGTIQNVVLPNGDTYRLELMGPGFSTHADNMVALYCPEDSRRKVEVVYNGQRFFIYRFKTHEEVQHYWSTAKEAADMLRSRKYSKVAEVLIQAFRVVFG